MSPRTGRPLKTSERPLRNDVKVRFDDITMMELNRYCHEHEISKAEAVRKAVEKMLFKKKK